ncbi:MAG: metal-dependent hydrolase [Gemmatimonadetes bacterium]|nr:metal-dependent hydrolase [Gemmatimonadota bacterium]
MPTPIGHALAGYAVAEVTGIRLSRSHTVSAATAALVATLPDADYLPGLLWGNAALYHRFATHSLCAALLVGLLAGTVGWVRCGRFFPLLITVAAAYSSHLILDWLTPDTRGSPGIQLLWPLTDRFFYWPILPSLELERSDAPGEFFASLLTIYNLRVVAFELALLGPLAALASVLPRRLAHRRAPWTPGGEVDPSDGGRPPSSGGQS